MSKQLHFKAHRALAAVMASVSGASAIAQTPEAQVISVTQEVFAKVSRPQVCWQTILTAHQKAVRERAQTPWLVRNWQPLVGAAMGGAIGFKFTGNFGASSEKWKWPTVAAGATAGAVAGPGFTGGAYGLGSLAYSIWPTSLPLTIAFSLVGGALGKIGWDIVFPKNPALEKPQAAQYLAEQNFYLETTCSKPERITYEPQPYLVKYRHNGKVHSARVKYYPGSRLPLQANGRPLYEIQQSMGAK